MKKKRKNPLRDEVRTSHGVVQSQVGLLYPRCLLIFWEMFPGRSSYPATVHKKPSHLNTRDLRDAEAGLLVAGVPGPVGVPARLLVGVTTPPPPSTPTTVVDFAAVDTAAAAAAAAAAEGADQPYTD